MPVGNHLTGAVSPPAARRACRRHHGDRSERSAPVMTDGGAPCDTNRADRLFAVLPDPAILADFGSGVPRVVRINESFARTFGYDAESTVGEPVRELLVEPSGVATLPTGERMGTEATSYEVRRETADGRWRDYLFRTVPADGTDDRFYGIYTDITERATYEVSLAALHETARELMAAETTDEVLDIGVHTARDCLGYEIAAIHRYDEREGALVPAAATAATEELLDEIPTFRRGDSIAWRVFETGETVVSDNVREDPDVFNESTPVRSEMLFPLGEQGVLLVVSTEQAAFEDHDRSLGQALAANIESALEQVEREQALARQNERLDEFASIVSHDLRTPLDLAGIHLELAAEGHDPATHLEDAAAAHERMSALIDDVLTWAREGDVVEATDSVPLAAVATECWSSREYESGTLDVGAELTVTADRSRLRQLLGNLFDNAVAHAGPDVTVTVGDLEDGFYVADDGPGVPPAEREAVFEFGQTHSPEGTGFGLAIVAQIVEGHDWSITLTESESGGARFEVQF